MSRSTSISVLQLTGCFPLPLIHSWRISVLICSASSLCLCSMLWTLAPVDDSKRRKPNQVYLVLISWGMLILLSLPRNLISSSIVGRESAVENSSSTIKQALNGLCSLYHNFQPQHDTRDKHSPVHHTTDGHTGGCGSTLHRNMLDPSLIPRLLHSFFVAYRIYANKTVQK